MKYILETFAKALAFIVCFLAWIVGTRRAMRYRHCGRTYRWCCRVLCRPCRCHYYNDRDVVAMPTYRFTWIQNVRLAVDVEAETADAAFDIYHELNNIENPIIVSSEYGLLESVEEIGQGPVERIGDHAG